MVDESQDDASESFEDDAAADSQSGGDQEFAEDEFRGGDEVADDEFAADEEFDDGDDVADDELADEEMAADEEFEEGDAFAAEGQEFEDEVEFADGEVATEGEAFAAGDEDFDEQFDEGPPPPDAWESDSGDEGLADESSPTAPSGYDEAEVSPQEMSDDIPEEVYEEEVEDAGDQTLDAGDSEPVGIILEPELESILEPPESQTVETEPLPEVGPYLDPATLTLWIAGEEHETFAVAQDQLVIGDGGEQDDEEEDDGDPTPVDIDLGPYLDDADVWNRHAELFRHNKNYTLCVTADGTTQLNDDLLELGEHRRLEDGDVVVLGGEVGLEFHLPETRAVAGAAPAADAPSDVTDEEVADIEAEGEMAVDSEEVADEQVEDVEPDPVETDGGEFVEPADQPAEFDDEASAPGDEFADDEFVDDESVDDELADEAFDDPDEFEDFE